MTSQHDNSFDNLPADKVVRLKEWKQNTKALYKAELSTGEKLFMNVVDKPLSVVAGFAIGIKSRFNKKSKIEGNYFDPQGSFGSLLYVSGTAAQQTLEAAQGFMLNKKYQDKINSLSAKGFEQSEDVSSKPIMQRLKPI